MVSKSSDRIIRTVDGVIVCKLDSSQVEARLLNELMLSQLIIYIVLSELIYE